MKRGEERGMEEKDGKAEEQVHGRDILIAAGASNPFGPPKSPRDTARDAVEQDKVKKMLDEIVQRQSPHIAIAENFAVVAPPPQPQMPQGFPPGGPPEAPPPSTAPGSKTPPKGGKRYTSKANAIR